MSDNKPLDKLIIDLKERAKELNCLYHVQELLNRTEGVNEMILKEVADAITLGFQYPDICVVKLVSDGIEYSTEGFETTKWLLKTDIIARDENVGSIEVYYKEERPDIDEGSFLKEERRLIENIAERIGLQVLHYKLKSVFEEQKKNYQRGDWWTVLEMLKQTDPKLLVRLSRKMVNYLVWIGVDEASLLLEKFTPLLISEGGKFSTEVNKPYSRQIGSNMLELSFEIFGVAGKHITEKEILETIQKWTKEDKSDFLIEVMEYTGSTLAEISSAIERYHHLLPNILQLSGSREKSVKIALIRRLLTTQHDFIEIAKNFITVDSFNDLIHKVVYPPNSHGHIGGKSAGLFLANSILEKASQKSGKINKIKIPRTWYLTSDGLLNFMSYNNLQEIIEQKYKEIGKVRQEYPYVLQVFKNSAFSPDISKGLLMALDDLGEVPLIVRSSSLLEDRIGAAFAGKYKSLFIPNQGTKEQRLSELTNAVSEVYASIFGPDAIEYRANNDLLDYHEEMGIMIQEVVGTKVGPYFFPSFAGVAFSRNEYRWSSRIEPEDGLVRLVPGLGTRAVDRVSNDYPIMLAPGKPGLRVNISIDDIIKYSPKYIDVMNLDNGEFETIEVDSLLKRYGKDYPAVSRVVSVLKENIIQPARPLGMNFLKNSFVVNFEGLIKRTDFLQQMEYILAILEKAYNGPVDIEFAHDGKDIYLLQCRSQSYGMNSKPAIIPENIDPDMLVFSSDKYISNGSVTGITHVVYVDPVAYSKLESLENLKQIGVIIGILNAKLPKRKFVLVGPGRWGSRGDVKLGVSVTYSDINNSAMLIEVAKESNGCVPDVSFGTHFFQDLVEADIKYLPLFPSKDNNVFNEEFILKSNNMIADYVEVIDGIQDVIRVVDVKSEYGSVLNVYLNANENKGVGLLENNE